ncbi:MAG: phosphoethanolamine transferase domain-containing protein [Enterobacter hormaechei]
MVLTVGRAAATYFMYTYGAVIDQNMIVNVFETNSQATALVTPQISVVIRRLVPSVVWRDPPYRKMVCPADASPRCSVPCW